MDHHGAGDDGAVDVPEPVEMIALEAEWITEPGESYSLIVEPGPMATPPQPDEGDDVDPA